MLTTCPETRHYCGNKEHREGFSFCRAMPPGRDIVFGEQVCCTRIAGHEGSHVGFGFSITAPLEWPGTVE